MASNCAKHVLAELKHAHVSDIANSAEDDGTKRFQSIQKKHVSTNSLVPRLTAPQWSPALLQGLNIIGKVHALCDDDIDNDAEEQPTRMAALNLIDRDLEAMLRSDLSDISELQKQIKQCAHLNDRHRRSTKKQPRGNYGFFEHINDVRVSFPRLPNETYNDYRKRLHAEAKQSWTVKG